MANNPNHLFTYVTATETSLRELCEVDKIKSPFWNIFTRLQLGLMPNQEALDIVKLGGEDFCSDVKAFVLEKAGRHPYLIQMMCGILFELRNRDNGFRQSHFHEGLRAFRSESHEYFQGCWRRYLDDEDKRTLKQILAAGDSVPNSFGDVRKMALMNKLPAETQRRAKRLIERGYLEEADDGCRIFSSVFEDFVRLQQVDLTVISPIARRILEYEEDIHKSVFIVISQSQEPLSLEEVIEAASKYVEPERIPSTVQVLKEKKYIEETDGRLFASELGRIRYE